MRGADSVAAARRVEPPSDPLARLAGLHPRSIDLTLGRVRRLLDRLGRPQDRLAPVIHVAGTNGKGSTVAMLRACLEAAGRRVHAYTSPHLIRFNERIALAGREIGDDELRALAEEVEAANAGEPITFFEIATAAALVAFAREPADFVLLETGLGGRLDATNVVPPEGTAVTAITAVGLDHQAWLGGTLAAIASEKAGILKAGTPAAIAPQPAAARAVIARAAARAGAPLIAWSARAEAGGFAFRSPRRAARFPPPALPGAHQIDNAGVALACLDSLDGPPLADETLARGLAAVRWPARLQRLADRDDREVWLDGGHNPSAGAALAAAAAGWSDRPLHLVVGMMAGKDPRGFLAPLAPRAAALSAVPIAGQENALPPAAVARAARALGIAADVADAPDDAIARAAPDARVLICGSLYLAGAVLADEERKGRAAHPGVMPARPGGDSRPGFSSRSRLLRQ